MPEPIVMPYPFIQQQGEQPSEIKEDVSLSYMQKFNQDIIRWLLDNNPELEMFEHQLKGEYYDGDKDDWVSSPPGSPDGIKPLANKKGANNLMNRMYLRLSKAVILSNLENEEVYKLSKFFGLHITFLLFEKYEEWGIELSNRSIIIQDMSDLFFLALKRAKDGQTFKNIGGSIERKEVYGDRPQEPKGFMKRIFPV